MRLYHHDGWIARVDKDEFYLTDEQYQILKRASLSGKTQVWFDDLTLSIPHVSYIERVKKPVYQEKQLQEPVSKDFNEKVRELKERLYKKYEKMS